MSDAPKKPYRPVIDAEKMACIEADDALIQAEASADELRLLLALPPDQRLTAAGEALQFLTPDDLLTLQQSVLRDVAKKAAKEANLLVVQGWAAGASGAAKSLWQRVRERAAAT